MLEAFKRLLQKDAFPSLFTILFVFFSIIFAYGLLLGKWEELVTGAAGVGGGLLFAILTVILRRKLSCGKNVVLRNSLLFVIIPLFCAGVAAVRVVSLFKKPDAFAHRAEKKEHTKAGIVLEAKMMRYGIEAIVELQRCVHCYNPLIIAYLPQTTEISSGDEIHFVRQPRFFAVGSARGSFAIGLLRRGISGTVTLSHGEFAIERNNSSKVRNIVRKNISDRLDRIFSLKTASLLKGLYFGNKNHVDKQTIQNFTWAGVLHILAASGAHLATVVFLPFVIFSFFRINRYLAAGVTTLLVMFYLWITDMPVSLVRASAMFAFGAAHVFIHQERKPLNILSHAASGILVFEPWQLYQLGFQLTFGATAGILLFYENCKKSFAFLPRFLSIPIALTVSAQSLVFPILAYQLGEVNIISVISNLLIVPLVQIIFSFSLIIVFLDVIVPCFIIAHAAMLVDWMYYFVRTLAEIFSSLPGHFSPQRISPALFFPYFLFLLPCLPKKVIRFSFAWALPASIAWAWLLLYEPLPSDNRIVIRTESSNVTIIVHNSNTIIEGTIGAMEDAREIVRVVKNHRLKNINLKVRNFDYRTASAVLFLIKNVDIVSFEMCSRYKMGRYLERIFEVLEHDGVPIVIN